MQTRPAEVEQLAPDLAERTVELDAVDTRVGVVARIGARGRAGRVAEDRHRARRLRARGQGQHEELVPVVAREPLPWPVDGVDGKPLVELQPPLAGSVLD